jgi:hypothetical protein
MRKTVCLVVLALVASAAGCKKENPSGSGSTGTSGTTSGGGSGGSGENGGSGGNTGASGNGPSATGETKTGQATAGCEIPTTITADFTMKKGCTVSIKESIHVQEGATLTIEEGVKMSFETDQYLWVDYGKLVVKGTDAAPVLFTSNNKSPAAGDWQGIGFAEKVSAGTSLDHLIIEYAGSKANSSRAALHLDNMRNSGRISITNSTVRKSAQFALDSGENGAFAKFENNTFSENKAGSLIVAPNALGSIGAKNKFGDPIHVVDGTADTTQTWPTFDVPVVLDGNLHVHGDSTAPTLTISSGNTIKMSQDRYISIGEGNGGTVVAKGVTFTSASPTPAEGDWGAIFLYSKTSGTTFDGSTFEFFGSSSDGARALFTLYGTNAKDLKSVTIANNTFRKGKQGIMHSDDGDCGAFAKAPNKNEGGLPYCVKN